MKKEKTEIVYCIEAESNCYNDEDCYNNLALATERAEQYYKEDIKNKTVQIVKRTEDDDYCLAMWKYENGEWVRQ